MVTVTESDVERIVGEVEAARRGLAEAERAYGANPAPAAWSANGEARQVLDRAETRERTAREQWQVLEGHRRARTAAGEAAVAELAGEAARLAETRQAAVEAAVKAVGAVRRALAALDEHDQAVRGVGAELLRRGLREEEGQATAVLMDGTPLVDGVRWPLVDGAGVLHQLLVDEVARVWPRHPLSRVSVPASGGRDAVLAEVRAKKVR